MNLVREKKNVDVDDARSLVLDAMPAHFLLDFKNVRH